MRWREGQYLSHPWRTERLQLQKRLTTVSMCVERATSKVSQGTLQSVPACYWIRFLGGEHLPLDKVLGRS